MVQTIQVAMTLIQYFLPVNQCSRHHQRKAWSTSLCCQGSCSQRYEQASSSLGAQEHRLLRCSDASSQFVCSVIISLQQHYRHHYHSKPAYTRVRYNITPDMMHDRYYLLKIVLRGNYSVCFPCFQYLLTLFRVSTPVCTAHALTEAHYWIVWKAKKQNTFQTKYIKQINI